MKMHSLFALLLFTLIAGNINAASRECAAPEVTTVAFYKWYLHELSQDKYPLISQAKQDKENLKKWVAPELINRLKDELSRNELDSEYFTDAQDVFDDWLNNIQASKIKTSKHNTDVNLALGKSEIRREYSVSLDDSHGCWKINRVTARK